MTDRKKPGVAFWAAVVVTVALVGYPLSIGPAYWIQTRLPWNSPIRWALDAAYFNRATRWIFARSDTLVDAAVWYRGLFLPPGDAEEAIPLPLPSR
jgi:hypothetical protein